MALSIGDRVYLVTWTLISVPSHLIGDEKEQLRMTCTLAVVTLNAIKAYKGDNVL